MKKNFTLVVVFLFALFLSPPGRLSAQINCETPANLSQANISPTGAVLYFGTTADTGMYNIRYHGPNTTTWTTLNNVTAPFQLGNLTCNTAYEWQAQRVCGTTPNNAPILSAWSLGSAFTTSACPTPTCPVPTYLSTTNISQTGAVLNLGSLANTGVFNIRYRVPNAPNYVVVNNVTMPYQLGNLTCHTAYEWQAQKICDNPAGTTGALSEWSTAATFTTTNCPEPTCPTPANLTATNISQTGAVLYAGTSTNAGTFNIRYHGPNSLDWITVNNVTMPFQLGSLTCHTVYEWQAQQVCANTPGTAPVLSAWSAGSAFTTANCPETTPCPVPANLTASNISQTGAVLHFGTTATSGRYNIRYHGPNSTTWITVNNVTVPFQLGNLTCHTTYEWQAQQICTITGAQNYNFSDWSVGAAFTTAACPAPVCPVPTYLTVTNISQTGVVLSYGANPTNGVSNIRYHGPNSTTWITLNNVTMPYQLGNLECNVRYEWQAQQVCANSAGATGALSDWSVGAAFTTAACPAPTCPVPTYLSTTNITPTGAVLNLGTIANTGTFNIRYHGPNSANWIVINNVTMPFQLRELTCHTAYEWQAQKVCTNADNTTTVLSDWSVGAAFTTTECPVQTCPVPANLMATNISQTGAVLNVGTATTGMYNIRYHGPNSTNWIVINNVTMPFQLGNLICHTGYEWQVQRVCANSAGTPGALSDWSVGAAFTTAACPTTTCPVPTYLATTNITQTGAVLNAGTATNTGMYNIRYHGPNSTNWIVINNVAMPFQLGNLICHTTYEWQAQRICANTGTTTAALSEWSVGAAFTTANCPEPTCPAPTYLSTTNITQTGAMLNAGTATNTGMYNIRYHGPNSANWIVINNVAMPYQLRELTCHTAYEWQAQKVCANADNSTTTLSDWSASVAFTTTNCTSDACHAPTNLMATNITQTGAVLHFGTTATGGRYNIRYHGPNSTSWITINNVTMPFQLGNLRCHMTYEWQAQQICATTPGAAPVLSAWSGGATFTTANCPENTCPVPTNLTATHIGEAGAVLQWNAITGVVAYVVQYKPAESNLPFTTVTSTTNFAQIGNLTTGTVYIWQVAAVCQNGTTIASWSPRATFTTRSSLVVYPNPANQTASVTFWSDRRTTVDVKLVDLYGKDVIVQQREAVEGNNVFGVNTSGVADGLYMIGVYSDGNLSTTKVVIKH